MFEYQFPMVSATATALLVIPNANDWQKSLVLFGKRSEIADACPGMWCLPGGFLNAKYNKDRKTYPGESVTDTLVREVKEETNINLDASNLHIFGELSTPDHDPRGEHVVSLYYWSEISEYDFSNARAGDDIVKLEFLPIGRAITTNLAFNHKDIVAQGIESWLSFKKIENVNQMFKIMKQGIDL